MYDIFPGCFQIAVSNKRSFFSKLIFFFGKKLRLQLWLLDIKKAAPLGRPFPTQNYEKAITFIFVLF
jgi:hypothetical protein